MFRQIGGEARSWGARGLKEVQDHGGNRAVAGFILWEMIRKVLRPSENKQVRLLGGHHSHSHGQRQSQEGKRPIAYGSMRFVLHGDSLIKRSGHKPSRTGQRVTGGEVLIHSTARHHIHLMT